MDCFPVCNSMQGPSSTGRTSAGTPQLVVLATSNPPLRRDSTYLFAQAIPRHKSRDLSGFCFSAFSPAELPVENDNEKDQAQNS